MEFEYELRNDAKVTSSSSDTPEKIGIFSLTSGQNRPIGGDNCDLVEIFQADMIWSSKGKYLEKVIDHTPMLAT